MKAYFGKYDKHAKQKTAQVDMIQVEFNMSDWPAVARCLGINPDAAGMRQLSIDVVVEPGGIAIRRAGSAKRPTRFGYKRPSPRASGQDREARFCLTRTSGNTDGITRLPAFTLTEVEATLRPEVQGIWVPVPDPELRRPPRQMDRRSKREREAGASEPVVQGPAAEKISQSLKEIIDAVGAEPVAERPKGCVLVDMGDGSTIMFGGLTLARRYRLVDELRSEGFVIEYGEARTAK